MTETKKEALKIILDAYKHEVFTDEQMIELIEAIGCENNMNWYPCLPPSWTDTKPPTLDPLYKKDWWKPYCEKDSTDDYPWYGTTKTTCNKEWKDNVTKTEYKYKDGTFYTTTMTNEAEK